ncbi:hypothetical protein SAMN04489761_2428 [Tenacibaculum sp. MAR_2009_124]|uniref:hypothetical protein n=1 Tax=Tenacibaculum sp. MAR_2009_124 TaxID=1250059 RepID=UPI00089C133A|nr:hypothetical protein [Tenacibaculum sp. MAR_2009_124]SEC22783.1 hypothetical protein SAMN04489761_2428 [Tenacibaculum sp. MAR_2009_124]
MKNQISSLGKLLKKTEQVTINGGRKQCKPRWSQVCLDWGNHCSESECAYGGPID